tara:strand:+ start:299 stop:508 length:210 start_codon:yes stop_codon:yes gene_type:complete
MHALGPKHIKLKTEEVEKLVSNLNISLTQLPKIKIDDPSLPEESEIGDVIRIERKSDDGLIFYFRVVSI